ncbi:hypothetical protein ACQPZ8_43065 [Actinomadura nitritigenes]
MDVEPLGIDPDFSLAVAGSGITAYGLARSDDRPECGIWRLSGTLWSMS